MTTEQERITSALNDDVLNLVEAFRIADKRAAVATRDVMTANTPQNNHAAELALEAFYQAAARLALQVANAIERDGYRLAPPAPATARPAPMFNPRSAVKAQPARLRLTTQQRAALEEIRRERISVHSDKPNRTLQSLIDKGLVYCGYQRRIDGLGPGEWRLSLTEDGRAALRGRS